MYNAGLNYDKGIWGEDANVFNPQRWVDRRPMWEFIQFFGGPRICPAQQQVLTQVTYLLVGLTREFKRIKNRDEVLEYVEFVKGLTQSRNGVKIALLTD
jgi:cytochrome P450